ncbi:MAG: hypothetical protein LBF42_00615 [Puniceicoccales bacterium]|jgi:hypothetical protein|nr:hypothetical protein [Puniceicoccales bacterium]
MNTRGIGEAGTQINTPAGVGNVHPNGGKSGSKSSSGSSTRISESKVHKMANLANRGSDISGALGYGTTVVAETAGLTGASLSAASVADAAANIAGFLGGEAIDHFMSPGNFKICKSIGIFDNPPDGFEKQIGELKQYNDLALEVLRDSGKVKDFHLGNETFGKKGARNKLKEGLKFAKSLKDNSNLGQYKDDLNKVMKNITNGKKSVQNRLNRARAGTVVDLASKGVSFAVGALSAAGDFGTSAAIGLGVSAVVKIGDAVDSRLGKTRGHITVQQDEGFLDGVNANSSLRGANEAALDILRNPNKRKGFGSDKLGKKEAKRKLKEALRDFDYLTQVIAGEGTTKVRADLENALRIVSRNLHKARGKKAAKIAAASAACVAAGVAIVSAGTATPLVATALALSALSAATKTAKTVIDLAAKE